MIHRIKRFKDKHPFLFIMAIALFIRMVAAIFSKGFGIYSDHFLVVEPAQSLVDGIDYHKILPWTPGNDGPTGHGFFYTGFHYLLFHLMQFFGLFDPQIKMFLIRGIHAFLSLLAISFCYRITSLLAERKTAYRLALLLAVYWFMPFVSVHNLAEVFSIPFIMYGTLIISRQELIRRNDEPGYHISSFMVAGFFLGLGFSVYFPTALFTLGLFIALLAYRNWKGTLSSVGGFLMSVVIFQGGIDFIIWRMPFAEFYEYLTLFFNSKSVTNPDLFQTNLLLYLVLLIPPMSLMLVFGFIREWRRHFLLFFPILIYILMMSVFSSRSASVMLPVIPIFILLGLTGWDNFIAKSTFWQKNKKLHTLLWAGFWMINLPLLFVFSLSYPHKARVESMSHLKQYKGIESVWVEDTQAENTKYMPAFYARQWPEIVYIHDKGEVDSLLFLTNKKGSEQPAFVFFFQKENLDERLENMRMYFPELVEEKQFKPSLMTRVLHIVTRRHENEYIFVYRNQAVIPQKAGQ
jgi:hypothetical protein